jgi:hypothetical protein
MNGFLSPNTPLSPTPVNTGGLNDNFGSFFMTVIAEGGSSDVKIKNKNHSASI